MQSYKTPGVYLEEMFPVSAAELRTGVPAFLGYAGQGGVLSPPSPLRFWPQFEEEFGGVVKDGYLACAVRGFFENGGSLCYVVRLNADTPAKEALADGLAVLEPLDTIDLICVPDIMSLYQQGQLSPEEALELQADVLTHCETLGDRFAILDSLPGTGIRLEDRQQVLDQREELSGTNGALYYPWIWIPDGPAATNGFIPPCGHVAGVYARSDQHAGVHKAPANEVLKGVLDLEDDLTDAEQGDLNPVGVNCLRAFSGRGIRVWGSRTLAGKGNTAWQYVNVRRLFLTAARWIERNMAQVVFEPNDARIWARIGRELTVYLNDLFQRGALKGRTPQEAFYVKCNEETNPPEVREAGKVVTEIGLAPALPSEFIVVRIIHGASGIAITGPIRPE